MAYLEEKTDKTQQEAEKPQISSQISGGDGTLAQSPAQQKSPQGTTNRFTNIQKFIKMNQPESVLSAIQKPIEQQTGLVQEQQRLSEEKFKPIQQDIVRFQQAPQTIQQTIQQAPQSIQNEQQLGDWRRLFRGEVASTQPYESQIRETRAQQEKLGTLGNLAQTTGGRTELIRQATGARPYSSGMSSLDQMLIASRPQELRQSEQNIQSKIGDVGGRLKSFEGARLADISARDRQGGETQALARSELNKAFNVEQQNLDKQLANLRGQRASIISQFKGEAPVNAAQIQTTLGVAPEDIERIRRSTQGYVTPESEDIFGFKRKTSRGAFVKPEELFNISEGGLGEQNVLSRAEAERLNALDVLGENARRYQDLGRFSESGVDTLGGLKDLGYVRQGLNEREVAAKAELDKILGTQKAAYDTYLGDLYNTINQNEMLYPNSTLENLGYTQRNQVIGYTSNPSLGQGNKGGHGGIPVTSKVYINPQGNIATKQEVNDVLNKHLREAVTSSIDRSKFGETSAYDRALADLNSRFKDINYVTNAYHPPTQEELKAIIEAQSEINRMRRGKDL